VTSSRSKDTNKLPFKSGHLQKKEGQYTEPSEGVREVRAGGRKKKVEKRGRGKKGPREKKKKKRRKFSVPRAAH